MPTVPRVPRVPTVPRVPIVDGGANVVTGAVGLLVGLAGLVGEVKWPVVVVGLSVDTSTCTQWSGVVSRSANITSRWVTLVTLVTLQQQQHAGDLLETCSRPARHRDSSNEAFRTGESAAPPRPALSQLPAFRCLPWNWFASTVLLPLPLPGQPGRRGPRRSIIS